MRISDWSSDVCSSDLRPIQPDALQRRAAALVGRLRLAVARQRPDREKTRDHRDQKRAGDPDQIFVDERLDRRPEQPEQNADEHEGKGPAGKARPKKGPAAQVDETGGDSQQLARDRRRAFYKKE